MDAAGKDGTIRHVMAGVNPQGCVVTPFKKPSVEEAEHDYLWRIHNAVPSTATSESSTVSLRRRARRARSQLVPKDVWSRRYEQINEFEAMLHDNDVKILKFFLHISKDEQKRRFQQRIEDPTGDGRSPRPISRSAALG